MVICLIILFNVSKKSAKYMVGNRIFKALVISTITLLILETASWLVDGRPGNTFFILNVSVNTALFAINPLPSILWYFYVNHQVNRQFRNVKKVIYVSAVILVVNSVLVITNIFTGTLFGIDSQNVYSRGPLFYFLIVTTYSIIAYTFFYLLINRKKVRKDELSPFLAFALPPVLGGVLQALFYGVSLIWSGVTISLLIIHTGIQQRQLDTDYLTGVYNRRQLENYLDGRIKASRNGKSFSGILIDVDDFKSINDEFGRQYFRYEPRAVH